MSKMFEITLKEINDLKDEIVFRPNDETVIAKCEQLTADYSYGLREIDNEPVVKLALWKLFNAMPRVKLKAKAIKRMIELYPDIETDRIFMRYNLQGPKDIVTKHIILDDDAVKVVVKLFARNFINGPKSTKEYDVSKDKKPRLCVFEHKITDSILIVQYDKHGKIISSNAHRPQRIAIAKKENEGR